MGRQSQIHAVTRSHGAVGDTVGAKVGDKVGNKVEAKWKIVGDKARSMSCQDLTEQWETQ